MSNTISLRPAAAGLLWLGVSIAAAASQAVPPAAVAQTAPAAQQPQTFGAGVTLADSTPLQPLIDRPADFEGKTVRVEGTVTAVCQHMGCWMAFAADRAADGRTLLVKVDDGVIVFPVSAKGRRAAAQGVIQRIGGADAESSEAASEHARSTGATPAAKPTAWQLKATGAVVY